MNLRESIAGSWHSRPADALAKELRTNLDAGISADEAGLRQKSEGFN